MKISKKKQIKKITTIRNKSHEMKLLTKYEGQISLYVDSYLILSEEGDPTQIALARQKAKNEFLKYGPEIQRIANEIGGDLQIFVADFIESVDIVLHGPGMLDEDLISHCQDTTARLQAELKCMSPSRHL